MKLKNILIGLIIFMLLLFVGLIGVLAVFFLSDVEISPVVEKSPAVFKVLEFGTAGTNGYAVYNYRGTGNITAISYSSPPKTSIVIINDSQAIDATRLPQLVEDLRDLQKYGYNFTVTEQTTIGNEIYIVPTGAIPSYVLFNLLSNSSNGTIIYIGDCDLVLSRGIKQQDWYASLTPQQRQRVVQFNGTLNEFNQSLKEMILYQAWDQKTNKTQALGPDGTSTIAIPAKNSSYIRLIYELDNQLYGFADSSQLFYDEQLLEMVPVSQYPWQISTLRFELNKTNGTAVLNVKKDGKIVDSEFLRRVTDQNVFVKKLKFDDPGEYIVTAEDNDEVIASGLLHIRNVKIDLQERYGLTYVFSVTSDGEPVKNEEAYVSLGESKDSKKYYVGDGQIAVNAKLPQGTNTFNFQMLGTTLQYTYENTQEGFFDIYIRYGLPGLALVAIIFVVARMSRKPMYALRFGESASEIREEIRVPMERTVESFSKIREDMNLGKSPITPQEFAISLKRYLTNGADVTEGNVEEILKKLAKKGIVESHRDYYQLKGEGDIKRNTLKRIIREKLIESGTFFKYDGEKFIAGDIEIGFYGQKFQKKAIIILDDKSELKQIMKSLSNDELSRIEILQANDSIQFVPIDKLQDIL
ncbi:hypothetical protein JXA56_00900 [Candidatus Micrarchaeota archaeon]|nr:hypothetical protein [Candidatus Micrarchaeota archaeon]